MSSNETDYSELERELELAASTNSMSPEDLSAARELLKPNGKEDSVKIPDPESTDIRALIADMTIPQRLKLAMFGNSVCRMLLVQDSSRLVQAAVLANPQLGETEVEAIAKNRNVSEYVLRGISKQKQWMKSYAVKHNLVFNPKTPVDVSSKWIKFLMKNDLRRLAKSKDVPQVVSVGARKLMAGK